MRVCALACVYVCVRVCAGECVCVCVCVVVLVMVVVCGVRVSLLCIFSVHISETAMQFKYIYIFFYASALMHLGTQSVCILN